MTISPTITIYLVLLLAAILAYGIALRSGKAYIRILFVYLLLVLVFAMLSLLVARLGVTNNLFLFHILTPVEYALISLFYTRVIVDASIKRAIRVSIPLFAVLCIIFAVYIQTLTENNSYIAILESILLICWTLFFLREVLLFNPVTALLRYPLFWISIGILIYFTENLVLDGILAYLIRNTFGLARLVYRVSLVFSDVFLFSLGVGAVCQIRGGATRI